MPHGQVEIAVAIPVPPGNRERGGPGALGPDRSQNAPLVLIDALLGPVVCDREVEVPVAVVVAPRDV